MMSTSPEPVRALATEVESFEYQEAGLPGAPGGAPTPQLSPANHSTSKNDLERALAQARAEGFREGMQQARQSLESELQPERARIAQALQHFSEQQAKYYARVEVELVQLALGIASKILHREAQVDRMLVAGLVRVALDKLQQN